MRILMLSKALVSGTYQTKCEQLAALPGVDLTVAVPSSWREPRVGVLQLERRFTKGYQLVALPIALNGHHHLHFYPTLAGLLNELRPDVFHIDEESFNLATYQAMRLGVRFGARCCFYNYANIERRYPWPFRMFERYSFRHATHALAANREAAQIIRRHGYHGPMTIIPQFGVDPGLFPPTTRPARTAADAPLTIGYIGRLVPEKGVLDLIEALALLPAHVCLKIIGDGVQRNALLARIAALGLSSRVELTPWVQDVPAALRELDVLALPSHTTANWKEQFGRILVEAMSSAIPVVGSSSGEIPHVVGNAGLIVPEGNLGALAEALGRLIANPALCTELGQRGRARILAEYTQAAIAQRYYTIYQQMLAAAPLMALPTSQEIGD